MKSTFLIVFVLLAWTSHKQGNFNRFACWGLGATRLNGTGPRPSSLIYCMLMFLSYVHFMSHLIPAGNPDTPWFR